MRGCIVKRGPKSWAVVVYLGRDPQTGKPQQKWIAHSTRREAEAHLAQLLVHVQAGGVVSSVKLRWGDYLEQWLRDYAHSVRPTTLKSYQDTIRLHLSPALGSDEGRCDLAQLPLRQAGDGIYVSHRLVEFEGRGSSVE